MILFRDEIRKITIGKSMHLCSRLIPATGWTTSSNMQQIATVFAIMLITAGTFLNVINQEGVTV
jgi:hypothetical protein